LFTTAISAAAAGRKTPFVGEDTKQNLNSNHWRKRISPCGRNTAVADIKRRVEVLLSADAILKIAQKNSGKLVKWRRSLHALAEPAFKEVQTAAFLAEQLEQMGLKVYKNIAGGTGLAALLKSSASAPTVAFRADMDALPLVEKTGLRFASKNHGYMHACGHDAHMAMVLGVPLVWQKLKKVPLGNLLLIFQPAEEKPPGGALKIIEAGVLDNPHLRSIYALHVNPYLSTGYLGLKPGALMAATDSFSLRVIGKGGHGAAPHQAVDAITVGSSIITAWQQVPSRMVDPREPLVVTVGTVRGGQEFNIIADEVEMTGTVRTLDESLRQEIPGVLEHIAENIAAAFGAGCEFNYERGYPILYNDAEKTALLKEAARYIFNEDKVLELSGPFMGGDDMAYMLQKVPGSYALLGVGLPNRKTTYPWHSPYFDLDEKALPLGTALFAAAAWLEFLTLER